MHILLVTILNSELQAASHSVQALQQLWRRTFLASLAHAYRSPAGPKNSK